MSEIQSINPYNQELLAEFTPYDDKKINQILDLSQKAFLNHKASSYNLRAQKMMQVAEELKKNTLQYARTITLEMGKPIQESLAEILKCAWVCTYYAENAARFLKDYTVESDADESFITYKPIGPVLAIMPWNFPFWQVFRFAAPAIMAGNTGVLKHASNVSQCALVMEKLFLEAGFQPGIFQTVLVNNQHVSKIIQNEHVKAVTLTGSEQAGAMVASEAGKNIKKTVLELGGSNAFVVLEDADLKKAVEIGVKARYMNTGQSCIAAKRFIINENVADDFLTLFTQEVRQLVVGDPINEKTQIGPLARIDLADTLASQVRKSQEMGANLLLGGDQEKAKFSPAILADVKPGMPAFDEELFGPVAAVTIFKDEEEAIKLVNHSSFGLGATLITQNTAKAKQLSEKIEDGAVFINELVKSDPRLPFGGTKKSGYGRELSHHGILEFVNIKTIYVKR